jgi:hypothetical protein
MTFPPAAVRDTTTVISTIVGKRKELSIDKCTIRVFQIQPSDLSLYEPAEITVQYEGTSTVQVSLHNPYVPVKDPQ